MWMCECVTDLCKCVGYLPRLVSRADCDRNLGRAHSSGPPYYAYTHSARESDHSQKSLITHCVKKISQKLFNPILFKITPMNVT